MGENFEINLFNLLIITPNCIGNKFYDSSSNDLKFMLEST